MPSQKIIDAIQGKSGEIRIDCTCQGTQKKTLGINADTGLFHCHRCGIKGNVKHKSNQKPFAEWVMDQGTPCIRHPYLEKKKINAHGLLANKYNGKQQLLVPYSAYNQISTIQTICEDGSKKFLPKNKGCESKGASHIIYGETDKVYVGEGFATVASINEATGKTTVSVAMKSNFIPSFDQIRHEFNGAEIIFCADNDKDGGGLKYAARAAKKFNAKVVMPEKMGDDFNDVWVESGADAVKDQLNVFLDVSGITKTIFKKEINENIADKMAAAGITKKNIINAAYSGQKGCANLFIKTYRDKFVHDRAAGLWYEFTGSYWELDKLGKAFRACDLIQEFGKRISAKIDGDIIEITEKIRKTTSDAESDILKTAHGKAKTDRDAISGFIKNLNDLVYRNKVISFATHGVDSLGISGDEWDQHPWKLAVKNGIVDLKTGKLKKGKPEDYIKSYCPTEFNKDADCPNFEKFMMEIMDNDLDLYSFLQSLIGAGLIGNGSFKQYVAIFSGIGRNGKDTLTGIIQHVLGLSLAAPIPTELILDGGSGGKRSSQGPSADMMKLRGLRLAYCNETSQGRKFNTGVVKQLSGGGLMTAREPYGRRNVDWEQTHMLFLMTNHKPQAPIDDYAFWKRIKTIHFPLSFILEPSEPNERLADIHLGEKLKKEASGILNFMIQGCLEYQENGLIEPQAVKAANLQYLKDVDQTGLFIDECCIIDSNAEVPAKILYAAYKAWSADNNTKAVSGTTFGKYIKTRYEYKRKTTGMSYIGIKPLQYSK